MRIDGMGVVGGFGCGISELAAGMEEGRRPETGIRNAMSGTLHRSVY